MTIAWSLTRSVAPDEILTLEDVGQDGHIRVVNPDEYRTLQWYMRGAEGAVEDSLSRSCLLQTWELRLDRFPCHEIGLPRPTIGHGAAAVSVSTLTYVDTNGTTQALASNAYVLKAYPNTQGIAVIVPAYGTSWPMTRDQEQAVTITYRAGLSDVEDVPAEVRVAMAQVTADLYAHRETTITGTIVNQLPIMERLLASHRCYWEPRYE